MSIRAILYPGLAALLLFNGACNLSKWVPNEEYRLIENTICVNGKEVKGPVADIIKQRPSPLIANWVYSLGNPEKERGFARWVSNQGKAPTVLAPAQVERTAEQIGFYYFGKGYFQNQSSYTICRDTAGQKAEVLYTVDLGPQYRIRNFKHLIPSPKIRHLVRLHKHNQLIDSTNTYDETRLDAERERLTQLFRENGHYGFSKNLIRYEADTSVGDHQVDITMIISDAEMKIGGQSVEIQHEPWQIKDVYVDYDFDYLTANKPYTDTVLYDGYRFLISGEELYRPSLVSRAIHITPGCRYSSEAVQLTYSHLGNLGVFEATEIEFQPAGDSTERILNAYVRISPSTVQSVTTQVDFTNTSGNYGVSGMVTWLNRNTFNAGEILDISLKGGIEAQVNTADNNTLFNTYEIGGEVGINFSRFLFPMSWQRRLPKSWMPTTRISTSLGMQTRVEFQRMIYKLGMAYNWKRRNHLEYQVQILDLNYVNLIKANSNYINSLVFRTGFQDNLITASRITVEYSPPNTNTARHTNFWRISLEGSGHLVSLYDKYYGLPHDDLTKTGTLFNVPYAQYWKIDADYRHYYNITRSQSLVSRAFAGLTYNHGNSPYLPPFEKSYLAGGSNDIRAWIAYRLGPGSFPNTVFDTVNYAAVGPIKLMLNFEYRFKIIGSLHGAIFLDMGNVWLYDRDYSQAELGVLNENLIEKTVFRPETFLRQSAVGTGFGLRYDFNFFQIRLDGGIKVWDPSEPEGYQYVLEGVRFNNVIYNFALGYPF